MRLVFLNMRYAIRFVFVQCSMKMFKNNVSWRIEMFAINMCSKMLNFEFSRKVRYISCNYLFYIHWCSGKDPFIFNYMSTIFGWQIKYLKNEFRCCLSSSSSSSNVNYKLIDFECEFGFWFIYSFICRHITRLI